MMLKRTKSPYTHEVKYWTHSKISGKVHSSFKTTADAVKWHVEQMQRSGLCFDIEVKKI